MNSFANSPAESISLCDGGGDFMIFLATEVAGRLGRVPVINFSSFTCFNFLIISLSTPCYMLFCVSYTNHETAEKIIQESAVFFIRLELSSGGTGEVEAGLEARGKRWDFNGPCGPALKKALFKTRADPDMALSAVEGTTREGKGADLRSGLLWDCTCTRGSELKIKTAPGRV